MGKILDSVRIRSTGNGHKFVLQGTVAVIVQSVVCVGLLDGGVEARSVVVDGNLVLVVRNEMAAHLLGSDKNLL